MKKIIVPINQEQVDILQRYGIEMDCRYDIVARIIENHKSDVDDEIFNSPAFKRYHHAAAEAKLSYEIAKAEFSESYLKPIVEEQFGKGVEFSWNINNFAIHEAEVIVNNA